MAMGQISTSSVFSEGALTPKAAMARNATRGNAQQTIIIHICADCERLFSDGWSSSEFDFADFMESFHPCKKGS